MADLPSCAADSNVDETLKERKESIYHTSGLPLPRFASLGKDKAYVRSGPGEKYPLKWVLQRKGYPVEIILEYETWRKIRDIDGQEGWIYHSMLSGKRFALTKGEGNIALYNKPFDINAKPTRITAYLEPTVLSEIKECVDLWCNIDALGFSGWIQRKFIWGVYEDENFD